MEQPKEKSSEKATGTTRPRTFYVDNIRTALTALVIFHHTAGCYGGEGSVPFQSSLHLRASSVGLVGFNAINQSFFMGSFFYISGYFSRKALERKSRETFVKDRLYRLGLPTLVYTVLAPPALNAMTRVLTRQTIDWSILTDYWRRELRSIRGPVWFTGNLLILDLIYAYSPAIQSDPGPPASQVSDSKQVAERRRFYAFVSSVAGCFFSRLVYPVGVNFSPLALQLAYAPQYIAAYFGGTQVQDILDAVPSLKLSVFLGLCSISTGAILLKILAADIKRLEELRGGWTLLALCYAIWNESTGYLIASAAFRLFEKYANCRWSVLADYAYPAFLVHLFPITFFGNLTDSWRASGAWKTIVIGSLSTVSSWVIGYSGSKAFSILGLL